MDGVGDEGDVGVIGDDDVVGTDVVVVAAVGAVADVVDVENDAVMSFGVDAGRACSFRHYGENFRLQ